MRLDDAASAVVQVGFRGGKRLVLVTKSDKEFVPFNSDYTDVRGLDEARDAINQFLGAHPEN
ncbi:MAG TPA: hypothetical protein VKX25_04085 [Bryobacteraceae bacterium]|nr:hypothetical protein [Bryobacteraceae bacterium]